MNIERLFRLDDNVAVVTGAARGLGKAMASALANAGANVVIADINEELAATTAHQLSEQTRQACIALKTDVTKANQIEKMVQLTIKEYGRIDILVNNAGIVRNIASEDMTLEEWEVVIKLNLTAVFMCSQCVGRQMIKRRNGRIINIASMSGIIVNNPQPQASYNASKAGVIMLTRSLAVEWAKYGIRVNAIAPGYMETAMTRENLRTDMARRNWLEMTPMKRAGKPNELAGAVIYLASQASSFVTGEVMVVDGGYTVL